MTITTLRPGSDTYVGSVTFTGAATGWQCVNDAVVNDATYISATNGTGWPKSVVRMKPVSGGLSGVGAAQRILRLRIIARIRMSAAASFNAAGTLKIQQRSPNGQYNVQEYQQYPDAVTFTNRVGVWRDKPPRDLGTEWTVASVESTSVELIFQPPSATGPNLRVSELYMDVDVRDRATVTAISITNPTLSTSPTVSWQYNANFDGDPQVRYQVKVFRADQYTKFGFNPATSQAVWDSGVQEGNATQLTVGTSLSDGQTYAAWVRVAADFGGAPWWSEWNNSAPSTIVLTPLPFPVMLGLVSDQPNYRNLISVQSDLNLLQVQDADFNSAFFGTGTWASFFAGGTLARVTSPVAEGAGACQLTKSASPGDMEFLTSGGSGGFRVKAGQSYTALVSLRAATTGRTCQVGVSWYDRTGTSISITLGTGVADVTGQYTQISYTGTAPANAVFAAIWVKIAGCAASEIHYMDKALVGTNVIIGSGTVAGASGTSRPVVAAIYDSGYWDSPSVAIAAKAVPPNSLLVAITLSGRTASTPSTVITSTGGLTWTERRENTTASTGDVDVSTAYNTTGQDLTITATGNQGDARTLVYACTGTDESSYGGAHNLATSTSGAPSVSLTTTRENSLVIVGVADFNEVNPRTRVWRKPASLADWREDFVGDFGEGVTYFSHGHQPVAGAQTWGLSAPTGQAYGAVAIEVRGASFNTSSTVYTGWSKGGWVGQVSTVVERAVVATGARNNAHPQLWSGGDHYQDTTGFFLPSGQQESFLTYDVRESYQGQGSIRWNVNNITSTLYMGWEDGPRFIGEPQTPLIGMEGKSYTFSLYAKADASFDGTLSIQALDQFGGNVGSPQSVSATIGTSWTQMTVSFVMPFGCLWVRAALDNASGVTERRVWVDGIQWVLGQTADVVPGYGEGVAVQWKKVRGADLGEWFITDEEAALSGWLYDAEAPPGASIVYRAYNYLPATETTPALASSSTFYATNRLNPPGAGVWILRDPNDPALSVRLRVVGFSETQHEESATFYPVRPTTWDQLGQRAVTITDFIGGYDGSLKVVCDGEAEWRLLRQLLARPRPMWLIFPDHGGRYVRFTDRSWERSSGRTRTSWNDTDAWRREISLTFLESDAP